MQCQERPADKRMKILFLLCALAALTCGQEDQTVVDRAKGKAVVEAVVDVIMQACIFSDDKLMLRRIAYLESRDGEAPDTFRQGYYGGIWQVEETQFRDTQTDFTHHAAIEAKFGITWSLVTWEDLTKPLYSALAARIYIDYWYTLLGGGLIPWDETAQAAFWATTYRNGVPDPTDFLMAVTALDEACEVPRADIVFVLDGSGSIGASNFDTCLEFVFNVVEEFQVEAEGVHIGVIQYSSNSKTEFYLGEITDKTSVKTEVQRIQYLQGATNTAAALDDMRAMFATYGRGGGIPQIGVVITDGKSTDPAATATAAQAVHDAQLTTFAVGITSGVDMNEVATIGTDPDCVHVFVLESFSDIRPFTSKIQSAACKAPGELNPDEEIEGEVGSGQMIYFKLKIKKNKNFLTIKLKLTSGAGRLFVSFKARSPSAAVYDYVLAVDSAMADGGLLAIPYPPDSIADEVEVFASLLGEGFGEQNKFKMSYVDGQLPGSGATRPLTAICGITMAMLVAVFAIF